MHLNDKWFTVRVTTVTPQKVSIPHVTDVYEPNYSNPAFKSTQ
jgi:hypothetical protein